MHPPPWREEKPPAIALRAIAGGVGGESGALLHWCQSHEMCMGLDTIFADQWDSGRVAKAEGGVFPCGEQLGADLGVTLFRVVDEAKFVHGVVFQFRTVISLVVKSTVPRKPSKRTAQRCEALTW